MDFLIVIFFSAFFFAFSSVFVLRPLAKNFGLVDRPCNRKQHEGDIPLVGGLSIYVTIVICSFTFTPVDPLYRMYLISTSFMVLIGALDDFYDIDARIRLIAQFLISSLMVFGADLYISNLGDLFGFGTVDLGVGGRIFTVLAVVTCINAFNMTDGVDGLVGILSLNTIISLVLLGYLKGDFVDLKIASIAGGALVAFLFFNFGFFKNGKYKIFMGDAGSTLIGLTLIWFITYLSQQQGQIIMRPITAVWLISVPLMDMFSVMIRRVLAGYSPLRASRDHLHHLLLSRGHTNLNTSLTIGLLSCVFCIVGIAMELSNVPEHIMAGVFVVCFIVYHTVLTIRFGTLDSSIPRR